VQLARMADIPRAIGAGLAEIGFTLESFTNQLLNFALFVRLEKDDLRHGLILAHRFALGEALCPFNELPDGIDA
jgi:hypothetical protein